MLDPTPNTRLRCTLNLHTRRRATCRTSCRASRHSGREGSPPRRQSGSRGCSARMGGADPHNPYAAGSGTRLPSPRETREARRAARSNAAHAHRACDDALPRAAAAAVPVTRCVASAWWSARTQRASSYYSRASPSQLYAAAHAAALGTGRRDAEQAIGPRA